MASVSFYRNGSHESQCLYRMIWRLVVLCDAEWRVPSASASAQVAIRRNHHAALKYFHNPNKFTDLSNFYISMVGSVRISEGPLYNYCTKLQMCHPTCFIIMVYIMLAIFLPCTYLHLGTCALATPWLNQNMPSPLTGSPTVTAYSWRWECQALLITKRGMSLAQAWSQWRLTYLLYNQWEGCVGRERSDLTLL